MTTLRSHTKALNQDYDYDLAIVGGGLVGLTLACALKDAGLSIALVEARSQAAAVATNQAYAIHLLASRIWEGLGVWSAMAAEVETFKQVLLSDANFPWRVQFAPQDLRSSVLGYVGEHRVLLGALQQALEHCPDVHWHCPARVTATTYDPAGVTLQLTEPGVADSSSEQVRSLRVRLLVAADGARSPIREWASIPTRGWQYWQSCVVATIAPEKPHNNIAYERFWASGPFAILPLPGNRCRIVWTAPHHEAKALLALDDQAFIDQLTERYGAQMGRLSLVGQRFMFPAKLMHCDRYTQSRLALVGDAAHCCHPVGGQGLNLGLRDAAALAQVIRDAQQRGEDIGNLRVLRRYDRWRRHQNLLILGMTDILNRLFSNNWLPFVVLRRCSLLVLQSVPPVKRLVLAVMAGLRGRIPEVAKI